MNDGIMSNKADLIGAGYRRTPEGSYALIPDGHAKRFSDTEPPVIRRF